MYFLELKNGVGFSFNLKLAVLFIQFLGKFIDYSKIIK